MTGSGVARIPGKSEDSGAGRCPRTQHLDLSPRTYLCVFTAADSVTWGMSRDTRHSSVTRADARTGTWEHTRTQVHVLKITQAPAVTDAQTCGPHTYLLTPRGLGHTSCCRPHERGGDGDPEASVSCSHAWRGPPRPAELRLLSAFCGCLVRPQTGRHGPCGCLGAGGEFRTEPARRAARGGHLAPPRNGHLAGGWPGQDADYTPWGWQWPSPGPWRAPTEGPDGTEEMAQASLDP